MKAPPPPASEPAVALRGTVMHCLCDPGRGDNPAALEVIDDAMLVLRNGTVEALGPTSELRATLDIDTEIKDWRGHLIVPGFIDTHVHYPQTDMIAAHGDQLLDWLNRYTFPTEARFSDLDYATDTAKFFVDELIRNGTTSAMVFCTIHPHSVDALFEAAQARGMCVVAGKVMMDRNCPQDLTDDVTNGVRDVHALIERWHGVGRLSYAVTPRFAPTSSPEQLAACGELLSSAPGLYLQTHVAENLDEVAWVAQLFPKARSYLDVYEQFGLVGRRSVLAHCIHLDETDRATMAERGASMAYCPTSNLFLGSGLFDMDAADAGANQVALATDVGGGSSFSMLRTMGEAYKVAQVKGQRLTPGRLLYLATLGGASAMDRDNTLGNFTAGKEADVVVLNPNATPLTARRCAGVESAEDTFFALTQLGDDRHVAEVRVAGAVVS
jgi:guanine deaminase